MTDLEAIIQQQIEFSHGTFGPGRRTLGIIKHIKKELKEIENAPTDLEEWIDVLILAMDGAWRAGYYPNEIVAKLKEKMEKNNQREWPDWREFSQDDAIEHKKNESNIYQERKPDCCVLCKCWVHDYVVPDGTLRRGFCGGRKEIVWANHLCADFAPKMP